MFGLMQLKHPDVGPNFPLFQLDVSASSTTSHGYRNSKLLPSVTENYFGKKHGTPKCEGYSWS